MKQTQTISPSVIYPKRAKGLSAYADMEDQTWEEWYEARMERLHSSNNIFRNGYCADYAGKDMCEELENTRDALRDVAQTLREEIRDAQSLWKDWEKVKGLIEIPAEKGPFEES